jgi:hypothetical protein
VPNIKNNQQPRIKGKNSMSAQEKLQNAIQATMEAGYQLNSEAFEFLVQNAQTSDSKGYKINQFLLRKAS